VDTERDDAINDAPRASPARGAFLLKMNYRAASGAVSKAFGKSGSRQAARYPTRFGRMKSPTRTTGRDLPLALPVGRQIPRDWPICLSSQLKAFETLIEG